MKLLTFHKLGIQAALLASRLKRFIEESLTIPINKVNLWTDSTTVCQWIRSSTSKHPIVITNRLSEILELTAMGQRKFVPGSLNPADSSTRLNTCSWIYGLSFLKEEFILDFEVSTTSTVAYLNSQFQAEDVPPSEKQVWKKEKKQTDNQHLRHPTRSSFRSPSR